MVLKNLTSKRMLLRDHTGCAGTITIDIRMSQTDKCILLIDSFFQQILESTDIMPFYMDRIFGFTDIMHISQCSGIFRIFQSQAFCDHCSGISHAHAVTDPGRI